MIATEALPADALTPLACPRCRAGDLARVEPASLACSLCGTQYPIVDGIPVLLAPEGSTSAAKESQAAYFDAGIDSEYEISRPHGTPTFHRWLLEEKFSRAVSELRPLLAESRALVVCGGSGLDAEFLARAGAHVITSDLSLGAARRARERAARLGLPYLSVVADVERLPVADGGVDLVYVHDGLHHVERPLGALAELARAAGRAVSVTEPADAAVTRLAVRAGLALSREEAGNPVARLTAVDVEQTLRTSGFDVVRCERYGMLYRHRPGRPMRALSAPAVLPAARRAFRLANAALGRYGNKLAVQAVRR